MRLSKLITHTLGLLLLATLVIGIYMSQVDYGQYKSHIEQYVEEHTGGNFKIKGNLTLKIGRRIFMSAEGWEFKEKAKDRLSTLSIGEFSLEANLIKSLIGPITIDKMSLENKNL